MKRIRICQTQDVPDGGMRSFGVDGKQVLVVHLDDAWFVVDDTCTHAQCSFGELGFLDGDSVVCGCHGASFRLADGSVKSLPATDDLQTYGVLIENDEVFITLP
jgi:nitrite reductase/ring-hydroxylating ferredoxin subunit